MRNRVSTLFVNIAIVAIVVIAVGCSTAHKIIKSGNHRYICEEAIKLYEAEEWSDALKLFQYVEAYYEGTSREDTLSFYSARCQFKNRDYTDAIESLDTYRRTYGRSPFVEDAEGMYALSHFYMSPEPERDQTMTHKAIAVIDEFMMRYPDSEQIDVFIDLRNQLNGKLHQKEFDNAYTYYKIERYKASLLAFKNALKTYPDSELREDVSFYIVASAYELAHNSVLEKKEDRYISMIDTYYTFIAEFPESEYRKEADDMLRKAKRYLELEERRRSGEEIDEKMFEDN